MLEINHCLWVIIGKLWWVIKIELLILAMADKKRKVVRSVPSSPVDSIKLFLSKTPIPTLEWIAKSPKFVKGVPIPVQEGQMTPNTEALSLLTGFATGQVTVKDDEVQHIPSISQSLGTIWETPKRKVIDGRWTAQKKQKSLKKSLGKIFPNRWLKPTQELKFLTPKSG